MDFQFIGNMYWVQNYKSNIFLPTFLATSDDLAYMYLNSKYGEIRIFAGHQNIMRV